MHIHLGKTDGHLESIELDHVRHHRAIVHLNQLIHTKTPQYISKIHISNSLLNHKDCQALTHILHLCPELTDVSFESNHLDLKEAKNVLASIPGSRLSSLVYSDNWIGESVSSSFFEFMNHLPDLDHLDFSLNWLRDVGMNTFLSALNPKVKILNLACNDFHYQGMAALVQFMLQKNDIEELDISYNFLDEHAAHKLASLITQNEQLKRLKLNSNQLGDTGGAILAHALKQNKTLEHLDCSDNLISKSMTSLLEAACSHNSLKTINLKHNQITHDERSHFVNKLSVEYPELHIAI